MAQGPKPRTLAARFWAKVSKEPHPQGCWLWRGYIAATGYGTIGDETGKIILAHRAAWGLTFGPIPKSDGFPGTFCVLHRCDNRACVNPAHLFLGTYLDNYRDMLAKGRMRNPNAERLKGQTHCKRGHEFTPENIKPSNGGRSCRQCIKDLNVKYGRARTLRLRQLRLMEAAK